MAASYASGTSTVPLLGETIGDNLRRTVARVRRPRGAGRPRAPAAAGPTPSFDATSTRSPAACSSAGVRQGRPGRHLGAELRRSGCSCSTPPPKIGAILVNINPAYRTPRAGIRAQPGRHLGCWSPRRAFKTSDYRAMVDEVRARCPQLRVGGLPRRRRTGTRCSTGGDAARSLPERPRRADASTTRSTSSTRRAPPGSRRARRSRTTTSSTTASSSASCARYTEEDRVCVPVPFYHCFGMVMGNLGATSHGAVHGDPGAGFDPAATLAAVAARALHRRCTACRRCSSPSSALPTFAVVRPVRRCAPGSWPARPARSR